MKKHACTVASLLAAFVFGCFPVHGLTSEERKELNDRFGLGGCLDTNNESYSKAKEELSKAIQAGDEASVSRIVRSFDGIVNSEIKTFCGFSTPLSFACRLGERRFDIVKLLLQNGANVNATDQLGATALHVNIDSPRIVDLLLEYGADISAKDSSGRTVLFGKENVFVLCSLLNKGVNAKAVDKTGQTALHAACDQLHQPELIGILADVSDVNAKDHNGQTPLHMLVSKAEMFECRDNEVSENVRILLRKGAEPAIQDNYGRTPLEYVDKEWPFIPNEGEAGVGALLRAAMDK
ncbi:MAG: ankyrin repeat domain-containing protein [Akkermansia sp.]|nr:ankyrin repeat domain-containing protein [Akkermansia sp.]